MLTLNEVKRKHLVDEMLRRLRGSGRDCPPVTYSLLK